MVDSLSIAIYALSICMLTLFSVDEILQLVYKLLISVACHLMKRWHHLVMLPILEVFVSSFLHKWIQIITILMSHWGRIYEDLNYN